MNSDPIEYFDFEKFDREFGYLLDHGWVLFHLEFSPVSEGDVLVIMVQQGDIKDVLLGKSSAKVMSVSGPFTAEQTARLRERFVSGRSASMACLDARIDEFMTEAVAFQPA